MCGGGGPSGETKFNWNDVQAPMWDRLLHDSEFVAYDNAYEKYGGNRIAGLSPDHIDAMGSMRGMLQSGGPQASILARNQTESTLQDDYLSGSKANPYAGTKNAYEGMLNPYFHSMLQTGMGDITDAYKQGTSADTTRLFNLSGAFGGSAHQNAIANNENALAKQLSQFGTGMLNEQYNRSGAMDESRLGRGASAYEGERGRQMGAVGAGQNEQDQYFKAAQQWMGLGDINRSMNQDYLNLDYQDWLDEQNQTFKNADWLSGIYSKAQGGMSPNSTTTQAGYSASPFSQLLGAGLLGYGMTR